MIQKMKSCQELIDAVDRDQPQLLLRSLPRLKWGLSLVMRGVCLGMERIPGISAMYCQTR